METSLAELLDHVPIFVRRHDGEILYWTHGCRELYGYTAEEACGRRSDELLNTVFPVPAETVESALASAGAWSGRVRQTCKSGREICAEVVLRLRPSANPGGMIVVEQATDITERVELEEKSALLMRELQHRVRNILAVVQALARMSVPDAPIEQRRKMEERISALAEANKLLQDSSWSKADLRAIVHEVANGLGVRERIAADGPDMAVRSEDAIGLALAVHELCTNAMKYGALTHPHGQVTLSWDADGDNPGVVRVRWKENGGPPVVPPTQTGFGTFLIRKAISSQPKSRVEIDYQPDGVACELYLGRAGGGEQRGEGEGG